MRNLSLVLLLTALSSISVAQQDVLDLARADIRTGKMGMVAAAMQLTEEQQEVFWPLYREYANEQEKLLEQRITMLQEFAGNYEKMTDERAHSIAAQSFAISRARLHRRERYFQKFAEVLGPIYAARFIQVDSQISTLMDFELMKSTPLIAPPAE
jgi:hypothetical protein